MGQEVGPRFNPQVPPLQPASPSSAPPPTQHLLKQHPQLGQRVQTHEFVRHVSYSTVRSHNYGMEGKALL